MRQKLRLMAVMAMMLLAFNSWGQEILTFEFSGLAGSEETATSNFNNANLNSSEISRGAGLTASNNSGRFNATNWAVESVDNAVAGDNYMEFTIDPTDGFQFNVSSVYLQLQRSGTGPRGIAIRNSIDNYASNLDQEYPIADVTTTQNFTFTFDQSNSLTPVTYRIYMWAEAITGSGGIGDGAGDDIIVNGTVTSTSGNLLPIITNIVQTPSTGITSSTTVSVSADAADSDGTIGSVELKWGTTSGDYSAGTISMTNGGSGDTYSTTSDIPAQADGTTVYYVIEATDDEPATTTSAEQNYSVTDPVIATLPYTEDFSDCGTQAWVAYSVASNKDWSCGSGYQEMNAYGGDVASDDYLVSPIFNLDNYSDEVMTFESWTRFTDASYPPIELLFTTNFTGDPTTTTWNTLSAIWSPEDSQEWTSSGNIDISGITGTQVQFAFHYTSTGTGGGTTSQWRIDNISLEEQTVLVPAVVVAPTSLTGFTYEAGSGPSASQSFTVEGTNLTSDITVTPPANYEISTDDVSFQSTAITLTQTAGSVATTTLYTRLEAGLAASDYNGQQITAIATDAADQTVTLDGNVTTPGASGLVFEENFDYPIGTLLVDNGWVAHSGTGDNSPDITTGLNFIGYVGSGIGGAAHLDANGEDVHHTFDEVNSGVVYAAFIADISQNGSAGYFAHLGQSTIGSTYFTRIWANASGDGLGIGASAPASYVTAINPASVLVVVKLDLTTKESSLFIFDSYPASEPATADASFTETANFSNIGSFALRQFNGSQNIIVDGIRIATSWAEAVAPGSTNVPPVIANISQIPATDIMDDQTVSVSADVTDSDGTIASVILNWGTTSGNLSNSIPMSVSSDDTYTTDTDIPAQAGGTTVYYAITATDDLAAETTSAEQSYSVVVSDPVLELTPDELNGLNYVLGNGPSAEQSFSVSGQNLVSDLTLDAPANYEISLGSGGSFVATDPVTLTPTTGTIEETPIFVRLKAGLDAGTYNGEQVLATATGATDKAVTLNGSVSDPSVGGGLETFTNLDLEGSSYADGSFLGQDGSTWTYFQSRGDYEITGKAIMLGRNRTPQANVFSGTILGGIGTLNFDYMQAFGTDVNLNVLVNDVVVGNVTSDDEQGVIKNSGTITVNVDGPVTIKFINANNSDGQVVIDNVAWTAYEGGSPVTAAPSFDPPAGSYADPIDVTLSSATANADIFFSQSSENGPWTAYSAPIAVDEATTIWAYAAADDHEDSPVTSAAYTFTDVVSVATIAELRAGATDGTVYQLTGEAVLTFQTSTRNQKFIQDATGAILIDDNGGAITTSYNLYDGITGITGTLTTYSNMLQFVPEADPGAATSTGNTVTPVEVSLDALDDSYQAQLVTVNFADFETTGNFAASQNYAITDPSGSGVMRTQYSDVDYIGEPIPTTTQNITGVILQFSSTMQLIPRSLADFEEANITDPFIAVSPTNLNGFSYEVGNGPSAEQSFVVSALNLTADLSLDAPANYEISLETGGSFVATDPVLLTPTDGTVDETTVYVRLKAGLDVGTYNGEQIVATSTGATDKTVTLNGNVSDPSAGGGFETFANLDYAGNSYQDGTFLGQDGSTWTYVQARGDLQITDESITLGRNRTPQSNVYSGLINGGISVINFDYMQAFGTDVNLNVLVNDVVVGNVTSDGETEIIKNSGDITVNVSGPIVIKFINMNNSDGQVVIDNILWTGYEGGTPVVSAPTFDPPAGEYYNPVDVTISSATTGAFLFYSTESATGPWTEYTSAINVSEGTTIWAFGALDGYTDSNVSSATYTFSDAVQVATIAELREGATDGTVYQLTGEAILTFQSSQRNQKFIQDETAAILIDDNNGTITTTYELYDGITGIVGTLTYYAEMLQFVPKYNPGAATSSNNVIMPEFVTLNTLNTTYQAKLVKINLVDFLIDGQFEDGVSYDITDPYSEGIFRTQYDDLDYIGTAIPDQTQNITGVILQFNDDIQLVARSIADFEDANMIDPYLLLNTTSLSGFSYIVENGPSTSMSYQIFGQNLEGNGNITVTAPENFEISNDDENFVTSLDFAIADGTITGQPVTVYVRLKADLAEGSYAGETISHTGGSATEVFVTLNGEVIGDQLPGITAEIVPQFIQGVNGTNTNRLPYAYRVTLVNLLPNATYRYINQAVVSADEATTNGAGNVIFVNTSGDFYRSTSPSFSTDGSYGVFTTDDQGSYTGWFITEATGNDRFTPGNEVFMRIRLNDGNEGTVAETYLTTTYSATVINFGTEYDPHQGTAIRAISGDLPKSFALLYDNSREGQPIAATSVETTGVDFATISQYPSFYKDEVAGNDGHWGTIIPNANANGIQLIEIRDLVDGSVLKTYEAANGVWGTTNTVDPEGGLDEILVINLIEIGLGETAAATVSVYATSQHFVIEKMTNDRLTFEVFNLVGQPLSKTELNGMGRQQISHQLSAGVYIIRFTDNSGFAKAVKVLIR